MNPLETYLTGLREIHDRGAATKETSGYGALAKLGKRMAEGIKSMEAIDLVCGDKSNEWAATTRERLWLEYFTAAAILKQQSAR